MKAKERLRESINENFHMIRSVGNGGIIEKAAGMVPSRFPTKLTCLDAH
jgi:hypothetical protein